MKDVVHDNEYRQVGIDGEHTEDFLENQRKAWREGIVSEGSESRGRRQGGSRMRDPGGPQASGVICCELTHPWTAGRRRERVYEEDRRAGQDFQLDRGHRQQTDQ